MHLSAHINVRYACMRTNTRMRAQAYSHICLHTQTHTDSLQREGVKATAVGYIALIPQHQCVLHMLPATLTCFDLNSVVLKANGPVVHIARSHH